MSGLDAQHSAFDTGRQRVGRVYAEGLLGAAEKHQVVERVLEQFDSLIEDVLDHLPKFEQLLVSPRVALDVKLGALERAFSSRVSPTFLNFLKVVAQHDRLDCLREMRAAYRALYNDRHGRVAVEIRTAADVDRQLLEQISLELAAKLHRQVELNSLVQPELLGGLVVRVGDQLFDGSLKSRLDHIRSNAQQRTKDLARDALQRFFRSE